MKAVFAIILAVISVSSAALASDPNCPLRYSNRNQTLHADGSNAINLPSRTNSATNSADQAGQVNFKR